MSRDTKLSLTLVLFSLLLLIGISGGMMQVSQSPGVTGGSTGSGTVSANNGVATAAAVYSAASGSTTIGPSSDLSDPQTGVVSIGAVGAANNGKITLLGLTSGSQSVACSNNTCSQLQTGAGVNIQGPVQFTSLTPVAGHITASSTAPTISSGFGTSPTVPSNNGTLAFTINVGTGGTANSGTIGLPAATTGWYCSCEDVTTNSATVFKCKQTGAGSTTTAPIGEFTAAGAAQAWTASDILNVSCTAF